MDIFLDNSWLHVWEYKKTRSAFLFKRSLEYTFLAPSQPFDFSSGFAEEITDFNSTAGVRKLKVTSLYLTLKVFACYYGVPKKFEIKNNGTNSQGIHLSNI